MTEKTCNSCIHFGACSKWTDFPKQCGVPVCASFAQQSEKYLIKENGDVLPLTHHSEWISVDDRMPERNGLYITHCKIEGQSLVCVLYCCKVGGFNEGTVTHWMPLPEPPEMKGGAE